MSPHHRNCPGAAIQACYACLMLVMGGIGGTSGRPGRRTESATCLSDRSNKSRRFCARFGGTKLAKAHSPRSSGIQASSSVRSAPPPSRQGQEALNFLQFGKPTGESRFSDRNDAPAIVARCT